MNLYKIGITHGDINGIGYEVIIKSLSDNKILELCKPIVYGLAKVSSFHRKALNFNDFSFQFIKDAEQPSLKKANLINLQDEEVKVDLGESTQIAGKMAELSIAAACKDLKNNRIDALVTAPINKFNIQSETFDFVGHTEYLSHYFNSQKTMMMMVAEQLKVGFVTNHVPIHDLENVITKELISNKIDIFHHSLINDFACTNPKIAVLSLNPHAGDNNLLGTEETEMIKPAISEAFENKINVFGPFPCDSFFGAGEYTKYDGILAMYHDQGMTPFKLLAMDNGVNFTAGLPVVRTSPAHGIAYQLAGKNKASHSSFRNAIYLAIDILNNRLALKE